MPYAELFCQTNFSFLQGASHAEELVLQANFLGYQAIAITDECSVAGVVRAHSAIKQHQLDIKLIVGSLLHLAPDLRIILLCPNRKAYAELCRIITNARRRSPKGAYELSEWDLTSVNQCLALWLPTGNHKRDEHWATWLKKHYTTRLWIASQRHLTGNEKHHIQHCRELSQQHQLPVCCCGAVLMHNPNRLPLQHVLSAIKQGNPVRKMGRELISNTERSLRPLNKIRTLFEPEWITETLSIAQRCQFSLAELRYEYPAELIPAGKTPQQYLRELVENGIINRFGREPDAEIRAIIEKELGLITEQKYEYFFLTIHDIVQFAKQQQILYQGRGSAANSIVCYCLEITSVDPRQINVLFERFISKERDEPPDIDVDFEHERREEVIQYIYQKYGRQRTALAATVITYRRKSAVREVGKALGINQTQLDFFIKNVNWRDSECSWESQIMELGLDPQSKQAQMLIQLVNEIIGFPRHLSQHVGGFVISSGPLYELVPVENAAMTERTVIQWDKDDLESLGLMKVDVLALGMLTAIRKAFQLIETHYQRKLDIAQITAMGDDPNVYNMIQKADTVGVFQIESRAQMSMLPRLRPANYYDLVIQIAIVRPGPIQGGMVHPFLKNRSNPEVIEYPSEELRSVLERTNGVPIFQEQVIKIAMVAAGFTGGEADRLRRAMGTWKKSGELLKFGQKLINGMLKRGYPQDYAERIFEQIKGFGEYGFPESHSASFAVLAYVSSWLKHYYPQAFYAGLLNSLPMGFYSASQLVQDAKRHNVKILPVCINHSQYDHILQRDQDNQDSLRLGLRLVKSLPKNTGEILVTKRPEKGYLNSNQLKKLNINRNQLDALASANALHQLNENRYATRWLLMNTESDLPLFHQLPESPLSSIRQPCTIEELAEDYISTGLSLAKHPIQQLKEAGLLKPYTAANKLYERAHKKPVSIVGVVIGRQRPGTSKGVTFMTLEDGTGNINVIVWLATARAQKKSFLKSSIVRVNGILERGDGNVTHIIAGKIQDISHLITKLHTKSRDFH